MKKKELKKQIKKLEAEIRVLKLKLSLEKGANERVKPWIQPYQYPWWDHVTRTGGDVIWKYRWERGNYYE